MLLFFFHRMEHRQPDAVHRIISLSDNILPPPQPTINKKRDKGSFSQRYVKDDFGKSNFISQDHCYTKNWNSQSDQSHAQSARYVSWTDSSVADSASISHWYASM